MEESRGDSYANLAQKYTNDLFLLNMCTTYRVGL